MADRLVKVMENGRIISRGLDKVRGGVSISLDPDETLNVTISWAGWLGSDTIASVANEVDGLSVASESNTTTQASFTVSNGPGLVQHRITTAAGNTKELKVWADTHEAVRSCDYGFRSGRVC